MRPIKRAIILCWIMLVACFAIKLFGWNWFEIVCTNEHFLKLCDFIENNKFLYNLISYFVYIVPQTFIILSICHKTNPTKNDLIVIDLFLTVIWAIYFIDPNAKSIIETSFIIFSPCLFELLSKNKQNVDIKNCFIRGLIGFLLIFLFQAISLFTRNIEINIYNYSLLVTSIMLFDYYIMIALFYLYVKLNKERGN